MNIAAIVPSLNPDTKFTHVIESLIGVGFTRIYIVNDGSDESFSPFFEEAGRHPECVVLRHEVNQGKGRALKTAIARYLQDNTGMAGVVTLDGDGQHGADDVRTVAAALAANPDTLILGSRDFSQSHVPAKSALGNKITRTVFRIACGIPITDTQTGLRGIPNSFARTLLEVDGERYEFETNMLLETKRAHVPVKEVPISTIYIDNNSTSHFRPLWDSLRIYVLILKFAFSSFLGFLVDYVLFALLFYVFLTGLPAAQQLFWATAGARVCSALVNFIVNKRVVFGSRENIGGAMARYFILAALQLLCSYGGVYLLSEVLPLPAMVAKVIVDLALFFLSFLIQKKWVFRVD